MMNPLDHSHDAWVVFMDDGMVHFMEAERVEGLFLNLGRIYTALDLSDLYLSHLCDYLPLNTFSTLTPRC